MSSKKLRLTQMVVDRIVSSPPEDIEYWDTLLDAFGIRRRHTGANSWQCVGRLAGQPKTKRWIIGSVKAIPKVADARGVAQEIMLEATRGIDRTAIKRAARKSAAQPPTRDHDTVAVVAPLFVDRYHRKQKKNRSADQVLGLLQNHLVTRWGDRELSSITRRDCRDLLADLIDRGYGPGANRVFLAANRMFDWAVEQEMIAANPWAGVKAPVTEKDRERVLTDDELAEVDRAAVTIGGPHGALVRVLFLTGQRRSEVSDMTWSELDLDRGVWIIGSERVKNGISHEVPLAPMVVKILRNLPRLQGCDHVFSSDGMGPITGFSRLKDRLDKLVSIENEWRLHDLRRSVGTGLARLGIAVSTISRVLNHREGGVTKIYNRYSYGDEKRHALEAWASHVERILDPREANVVPLRPAL